MPRLSITHSQVCIISIICFESNLWLNALSEIPGNYWCVAEVQVHTRAQNGLPASLSHG